MKRRVFAWLSGVVLALASTSPQAAPQQDVVRLATAEWPPYLGEGLPGQGALASLLRDAFARGGYRLDLQFFPWARTLQVVRDPAAGLDGYVVDYYSDEVARDYLVTRPVFHSPLVVAESSARPVAWKTVADLSRYRFGLVSGYTNTREFDLQVARGEIQAEFVNDDFTNLRRLAAGRVDAVTVDRYVLAWLAATDPALSRLKAPLRASGRVLEEKALHACFVKSPRGAALRTVLESGLRGTDVRKVIDDYVRNNARATRAALSGRSTSP